LIADPDRRAQLGSRASARASAQFSWSLCADRYLAIADTLTAT